MLKKEIITIAGIEFTKHYSDSGVFIRKTDTEELYDEAIDSENTNYTYEETEEIIDYGTKPDVEEDDA